MGVKLMVTCDVTCSVVLEEKHSGNSFSFFYLVFSFLLGLNAVSAAEHRFKLSVSISVCLIEHSTTSKCKIDQKMLKYLFDLSMVSIRASPSTSELGTPIDRTFETRQTSNRYRRVLLHLLFAPPREAPHHSAVSEEDHQRRCH